MIKLEISNISKKYLLRSGATHRLADLFKGGRSCHKTVLDNFSFKAGEGDIIYISGKNGCGKSTLLRCIAGITRPDSGTINLNGRLLYILQHGLGIYENLTIEQNILLIQQIFKINSKDSRENLNEIITSQQLDNYRRSPMTKLSDGMKAKLLLTCLQYASFDILLLDETFNSIDREWILDYKRVLQKWSNEGKIILFTTHDKDIGENLADTKMEILE
jgi:ABC-type polysaccharide/polyol phosphate transport system ATPase subunit